jgi:hypothetical protein
MALLFVNLLGQGLMAYSYYLAKFQIKVALVLIKTACFFNFWGFIKTSMVFEKGGDYFYEQSKINYPYYNEIENDDVLD